MSCQLCGSNKELGDYNLVDEYEVMLCRVCREQIEQDELDATHFNCLNDAMWSEDSGVKVLSYLLWERLGRGDMCDMIYLDDKEQSVLEAMKQSKRQDITIKDANGVELKVGDSVVILKDLDVKGAGFVAKRGTTVRNIAIPKDTKGHIEGRVNGVKIYIKSEFVKRA